MPSEHLVNVTRRTDTGEGIDGLEHCFRGNRAAHALLSLNLVPNLSVAATGLFEETNRGRRLIAHDDVGAHAAKLRDHPTIQIDAARILGCEMDFDTEG